MAAVGCLLGATQLAAKPHKPHHYASSLTFDGYTTHYSPRSAHDAVARGNVQGFNFYGLVKSSKSKCQGAGRRIDVVHVNEGTNPDQHIGFDLSDSHGGWSVFKPHSVLISGTYLATLKSKKVGGDICGGDSASFVIDPLRP